MTQIMEVPIEQISPSQFQPRREFDALGEGKDEPAIDSPEDILIPLLVRPRGGGFELVDGERRLRRLKAMGAKAARCELRPMSDEEAAITVLRVNSERRPLDDFERARWLATYMTKFHANQIEAAKAAHFDKGTASRLKDLAVAKGWLGAPDGEQTTVGTANAEEKGRAKPLTEHKLKEISALPKAVRPAVIKAVIENNVSTDDTKVLVAKVRGGRSPEKAVVEMANWRVSHRQEAHQDSRRRAGKKAAPRRNYALCEDCGDRPYFIHVGPGEHRFSEEDGSE